jgi:predicted hydrocarbon binding protein
MGYVMDEILEDKIGFIQKAYDLEQYDTVVKESCGLFEVAFRKIFAEAVAKLPYGERMVLMDKERIIGDSRKGVQEFGLGQLVGLFRECDLLKRWAKFTGRDIGLIDTLNFNSIVELRNRLTHDAATCVCNECEAEIVFIYLKNFLANYDFIDMKKINADSFKKKETNSKDMPTTKKQGENYAKIRLNEERGIIINEADGTRNISFKVDTINSMLEAMYSSAVELSNVDEAKKILFDIGYQGGKRFGEAMNKKWEMEEISYGTKISKWCEFDSVVGWGKFSNNLEIDTQEGVVNGHITITENFLCYNRKKKNIRLCDFVVGYSTGVLEELLNGIPIELICDTDICPQDNPFRNDCSFKILVK